MQQPADALDIIDGTVQRKDLNAGPSITLADIAKALQPGSTLRGVRALGLSAEGTFYSDHMNYPYGVHIAVARVDRDTAGVTIERYFIAYDIGRAVNPMLVQGQLAGGMAQGIGGALLEEFLYDERGEPLSVNFADYLMPTSREVPQLELLITEDAPSPLNPLGLKGAGKGESMRSAPRLPLPSMTRSEFRERSRSCRSPRSGCTRFSRPPNRSSYCGSASGVQLRRRRASRSSVVSPSKLVGVSTSCDRFTPSNVFTLNTA